MKSWKVYAAAGVVVAAGIAAGMRNGPAPAEPTPPELIKDAGQLRLISIAERDAFRRWFTYIAEAQFGRDPLPLEIDDCGALLRFAYREALREHDSEQAERIGMQSPPPASVIDRFRLRTPRLFAVPGGPFREFADAETLMRHNAHFVSRDLERALAGDLLFYRQLEQRLPFHAMIVLGREHIAYHTGDTPGEVRRPSVAELRQHREPRWRPVASNPYFLGVYRWNILRGS